MLLAGQTLTIPAMAAIQLRLEAICSINNLQITGGEGEIRTPDTRQGMAAFEAARFNRSRTSPRHGLDNLTRPL